MQVKIFKPSELRWDLDFKPIKPWPSLLPVIYVLDGDQPTVVAGFDRVGQSELAALSVSGSPREAMSQLWPEDALGGLEKMRLHKQLGIPAHFPFLLNWPLELQNLFDRKQVSPKSLRPLQHLTEWMSDLTTCLIRAELTSSQLREAVDLLCDLKLSGLTWHECAPGKDATHWISELKKRRNPMTAARDQGSAELVEKISWPRGVSAKWERQGDQGSLVLQTKLSNHAEWNRFREGILKVQLEDLL
jgi:hypothetical protein